jgi:two-component system NtrC family sensor kinase
MERGKKDRTGTMDNTLREAALRYRTLFEQSPDGIVIIDEHGSIVEFNRSAYRRLGYSREEFAKLRITDIDAFQTPEEIQASMREVLEKGRAEFEVAHRTKTGDIRNVHVITQVLELSGKRVFHTLWRDITERKRAEAALLGQKAFTESALNTLKDIFFVFTLEGRFVRWNESLGRVTGYSNDEISSMRPVDFVVEEDAPRVLAAIRATMKNGYTTLETRIRTRDGREIPFEFSGSLLRDYDGRITGISGIGRDVTRRKHTEEALRENERNFRALSQEFHTLLDAISDALLLISPDLKVIWANKGAVSLFNRKIPELQGTLCHELLQNSPSPEDCCAVRSFRSGKAEGSQITMSGGRICDARSFPIKNEQGEVKNVIMVISDITEKLTLEAEAMRAGHLASLGELAAGVAHEINNPINGIINYAQILVNSSAAGTTENDIAGRIIREGERIAGLVTNLLSLARERKGEGVPVRVYEVLEETLSLLEAQFRKEGITLDVTMPDDLPEIVANPQQIQQVFLNIISNAHYALNQKYPGKHADKIMRISGEKVEIDSAPFLRMVFYDRGSGIPADVIGRVMDPFFSTKPRGEGTGLGLSISHGIVMDHKGHMHIESVENEYTKVIIDLPAGNGVADAGVTDEDAEYLKPNPSSPGQTAFFQKMGPKDGKPRVKKANMNCKSKRS